LSIRFLLISYRYTKQRVKWKGSSVGVEFEGIRVLGKEESMKSYVAYGVSIIVIVISACSVIFLPLTDEIKTMFSLPGIAGLFSLLIQGWRDQVAHERTLELQQKKNEFDLAVASHMANVVFDKQVEFSEQYSQKLYSVIQLMGQEGPSENTLSYATELQRIRIRFAPWVSNELNHKLMPYEAALREIGALATVEKFDPNTVSRGKVINKMYSVFAKFLGIDFEGTETKPEDYSLAVLEHLKDVLNIPDLETLRRNAIKLATFKTQDDK
jgi:hypothetical protein